MSKFNYILNDLAFDTLVIKCLYGEPTDEDAKECENQIELLKQENQQLKNDNAVMKANLIQVSDRQRDLYKEIIEEVRECVNIENLEYASRSELINTIKELQNKLQILDKAKED